MISSFFFYENLFFKSYKNAHTDLIVKHNKCGKEFKTSYKRLVTDGQRCPNTKKTQEQFEKEVYDLVGDEYKVVGKYISSGKKIEIKRTLWNCFTPRAVDF